MKALGEGRSLIVFKFVSTSVTSTCPVQAASASRITELTEPHFIPPRHLARQGSPPPYGGISFLPLTIALAWSRRVWLATPLLLSALCDRSTSLLPQLLPLRFPFYKYMITHESPTSLLTSDRQCQAQPHSASCLELGPQ